MKSGLLLPVEHRGESTIASWIPEPVTLRIDGAPRFRWHDLDELRAQREDAS